MTFQLRMNIFYFNFCCLCHCHLGDNYEDFVDNDFGHDKTGLFWGSFVCVLDLSLRSMYRMGIFWGGC